MKWPACLHVIAVFGGAHSQMYGLRWQKHYQFYHLKPHTQQRLLDVIARLEEEEWGRDITKGEHVLVKGLKAIDHGIAPAKYPICLGDTTEDDLAHAMELATRWQAGNVVVRHQHNITPRPTPRDIDSDSEGEEEDFVQADPDEDEEIGDEGGAGFPSDDEGGGFPSDDTAADDDDCGIQTTGDDVVQFGTQQSAATRGIMEFDAAKALKKKYQGVADLQGQLQAHGTSLATVEATRYGAGRQYFLSAWKIAEGDLEMMKSFEEHMYDVVLKLTEQAATKAVAKGGGAGGSGGMSETGTYNKKRKVRRRPNTS
jgi:hypothetical protein